AHALRAQGGWGGAGAGDALPRLSGVAGGAGSRWGARGVATGFGGGGKNHAGGAAGSPAGGGLGRGGPRGAGRAGEHGAEGAGAPAWSDAQYLHASGVGSLARPNERA